jgi:hypothetical protein
LGAKNKGDVVMEGIQFVVDEKGEQVAVQIDLRRYRDLWEDFYDSLIAHSRAVEPRESLETVQELLRKQGKLDG